MSKNSNNAFYDYCKGKSYKFIQHKYDVSMGTVKAWSQRGPNGKKWTELKEECIDVETGKVDLERVKLLIENSTKVTANQLQEYYNDLNSDTNYDSNDKVDVISNILNNTLKYYNSSVPSSDLEVEKRIECYFIDCVNNRLVPTIEGVCNCLGITYAVFESWKNGKRGTVRSDLIKRALSHIQEFDTQMVIAGKIPQSLYAFRSKNFYGMKDQVEQSIVISDTLGEKVDKKEILSRLDSIDVDCE